MPLSSFSPSRRRVAVVEKVASEAYVDPGISSAVSSGSAKDQVSALRASGASPSELRVVSRKLEERGGLGGMITVGLVGSLISFFAGRGSRGQHAQNHAWRGNLLVALAVVAAGVTVGSLLRRRESRKLASTFEEAASGLDVGATAAA